MKYVKATCAYVFARFFRLTAISVVPSFFLAFFMQAYGMGLVFPASAVEGMNSFPEIFFLVFDRGLLVSRPYLIPVGIVLLLVCVSWLTGMVEKHFRTGKLSVRMPFANINNCFPPVFKVLAVITVIYVLYKVVLSSVLMLISYIMGNIGTSGMAESVVMSVFSVASFFAVLLLVRPILMAPATMLVYGYSMRESFGVALKNAEGSKFSLGFGLIAPFIPYVAVSSLMVILGADGIVYSVIMGVMNTLLIPYIVVFILGSMFEISGIERRDRRPY